MNLSQLHYFKIIAEEEHISRAAERLHISQPSLSGTIQRLEAELDTPLFDRRGRNIYLNSEGRRLLNHVRYIFAQIEDLEDSLTLTRFNLANKVVLAVNNSMFLDGWLSQFILAHRDSRISQTMMSEDQMIAALLNEDIDLALGDFREVPSGLSSHVLLEDEYLVTMPKLHPLAQKTQLNFEDIRNEPFVSLSSNMVNPFIHHLYAQKDAVPNIIMEGSHRMLVRLLFEGRALAFASRRIARQQMSQKYHFLGLEAQEQTLDFLALPVVDLETDFTLTLCWKKGRPLPAMAEALRRALIETYHLEPPDTNDSGTQGGHV